jgi:hypothetical protein
MGVEIGSEVLKIAALVLALALTSLVSGCGGKIESSASKTSADGQVNKIEAPTQSDANPPDAFASSTKDTSAELTTYTRETDVVDLFEMVCLKPDNDFAAQHEILMNLNAIRVPNNIIDPKMWGILSADRAGFRLDGSSDILIALDAQGRIRSETRRLFSAGITSEADFVSEDSVLPDPMNKFDRPVLGVKSCTVFAHASDLDRLMEVLGKLSVSGAQFPQHEPVRDRVGKGPDQGKSHKSMRWDLGETGTVHLSIGPEEPSSGHQIEIAFSKIIFSGEGPSKYKVK